MFFSHVAPAGKPKEVLDQVLGEVDGTNEEVLDKVLGKSIRA